MAIGDPRSCRYCGAPLGAVPLDHCAAPLCAARHGAALRRREAARLERVRADGARQVAAARGALLREIAQARGLAPDALLIGPVPDGAPVLEPQDPARRAQFMAHCEQVLEAAFAVPVAAISPTVGRHPEGAEPAVTAPACGTCRGKCCRLGARHMAFVKVSAVQGLRKMRPRLEKADFRAAWRAALPEESVAGSCIFNGARGCTLEREWRADICNAYHCEPLTALIGAVEAAPGRPVVIAGLTGSGGIGGMALMSPEGDWAPVEPAPEEGQTAD